MSEWTDELKAQVVEEYEARNPTPENTTEILAELAEEFEKTPNGVRMILTKAGVYVKKTPASKSTSNGGSSGTKRVSKADAIAALEAAISSTGQDPSDEIISKLTGKAAQYFTEVINNIKEDNED